MANIGYWLLAILMFGLLILLHELGHFLAARLTRVRVMEFAVGFGPPLWKRKAKSGVVYSVRVLPLGGYCRFADDAEPDCPPEDAYYRQKIWKRVVVSLAGAAANAVTALVILFLLFFALTGLPEADRVVGAVTPGMPAEAAGFRAGDTVLRVNGEAAETAEAVSEKIAAAEGEEILFTLLRDGQEISVPVRSEWSEADDRRMIGIQYAVTYEKYHFFPALRQAGSSAVYLGGQVFRALRGIVTGLIGVDQLAGPVGTVALIREQTEASGLVGYCSMAAMISVNLALFNLLPVPGLDGSKLIFLGIEKLRGKRMNPAREGAVMVAGLVLLLMLFAVVMVQDITRLIA